MFKYVCLSLSLFLALNGNFVQGTPTGAPLVACADMTPQHGPENPAQTSPSPFGTTPSSVRIFIYDAIRHSVSIDLIYNYNPVLTSIVKKNVLSFYYFPVGGQTSIAQGSTITLTLTGSGPFKGFLVIAFDNANQAAGPIGAFSAVSSGQTLDCRTGATPMVIRAKNCFCKPLLE
jgi:hypothetical protein